jgi:hypothetical protein
VKESVNHPQHYGGDSPYETIKVIEAWNLGFNLGNAVKYISRADKKGKAVEDLHKAAWYVLRELAKSEGLPETIYTDAIAARKPKHNQAELFKPNPSDRGKCIACKMAIDAPGNAMGRLVCKDCLDADVAVIGLKTVQDATRH